MHSKYQNSTYINLCFWNLKTKNNTNLRTKRPRGDIVEVWGVEEGTAPLPAPLASIDRERPLCPSALLARRDWLARWHRPPVADATGQQVIGRDYTDVCVAGTGWLGHAHTCKIPTHTAEIIPPHQHNYAINLRWLLCIMEYSRTMGGRGHLFPTHFVLIFFWKVVTTVGKVVLLCKGCLTYEYMYVISLKQWAHSSKIKCLR